MNKNSHIEKTTLAVVVGLVLILGVSYKLRSNVIVAANGGKASKAAVATRGGTGGGTGGGNGTVTPCNPMPVNPIVVSPRSATAINTPVAGNNNDTATFEIKFSVRAVGCDIYLSSNPTWIVGSSFDGLSNTTKGTSVVWSGASFGVVVADNLTSSLPNGNWKIAAGTTQNFTQMFYVQDYYAGGAGQYRGFLKQLRWNFDDSTTYRVFTTGLGTPTTTGPYTTPYVQMN